MEFWMTFREVGFFGYVMAMIFLPALPISAVVALASPKLQIPGIVQLGLPVVLLFFGIAGNHVGLVVLADVMPKASAEVLPYLTAAGIGNSVSAVYVATLFAGAVLATGALTTATATAAMAGKNAKFTPTPAIPAAVVFLAATLSTPWTGFIGMAAMVAAASLFLTLVRTTDAPSESPKSMIDQVALGFSLLATAAWYQWSSGFITVLYAIGKASAETRPMLVDQGSSQMLLAFPMALIFGVLLFAVAVLGVLPHRLSLGNWHGIRLGANLLAMAVVALIPMVAAIEAVYFLEGTEVLAFW